MLNKILDLFQQSSLPFVDKNGGPKLDFIQQWLNHRNIKNEYVPGTGLIVNKIDKPRIILVSHIDLIKRFQKGFAINNTFEVIKEEGIVRGALDNTITNAAALLAIDKLFSAGITDIEVLFSEGEEVGSIGIERYLKNFPKKSSMSFFLNLDVTNDGWGKSTSIEYDKPEFRTIKSFQKILSKFSCNFQGDRDGDDIDAVNSANCHGLSFCLPTKGNIHSYKNYATLDSVSEYFDSLFSILKSFKKSKKYVSFSSYQFKAALKTKSYKKFNTRKKIKTSSNPFDDNYFELETPPLPRSRNLTSSLSKIRHLYPKLSMSQLADRSHFISEMLNFFVIDNSCSNVEKVTSFFEDIVYGDSSFSVEFMSDHIEESYNKCLDILTTLEEMNTCTVGKHDQWKFKL